MGVLDLYKRALQIFRANPVIAVPFIGVLVVAVIIGIIIVALSIPILSSIGTSVLAQSDLLAILPHFTQSFILEIAIAFLAIVLIGIIFGGIIISMADQGYAGKKVSLGTAFEVAKEHYVGLVEAGILVFVMTISLFVVPAVLLYLAFSRSSVLLGIIAVVLFIVALFLVLISFYLPYVLVVLEGMSPIKAIKRSYYLGVQNKATIVGILFTAVVISTLINAVQYVFAVFGLFGAVLGALFVLIATFIYTVVVSLIPVVFYREYIKPVKRKSR